MNPTVQLPLSNTHRLPNVEGLGRGDVTATLGESSTTNKLPEQNKTRITTTSDAGMKIRTPPAAGSAVIGTPAAGFKGDGQQ